MSAPRPLPRFVRDRLEREAAQRRQDEVLGLTPLTRADYLRVIELGRRRMEEHRRRADANPPPF